MYNLFISHSWAYSDHYERLISLLNSDARFQYKDYSVPKNNPIHNTANSNLLALAIREQMSHASCVLILAGMYSTYSKWINIEINLAQKGFMSPKPIIAIQPWGADRTSTVVKQAANEIVAWQTSSIVSAVRRLSL